MSSSSSSSSSSQQQLSSSRNYFRRVSDRLRPTRSKSVPRDIVIENRRQSSQVHSDIRPASNQATPYRTECVAQDRLIDDLQQVIHRFMARPDRRHSYKARMHWSADHAKELNFHVTVVVEEPTKHT